ncbi:MAG: hypothetical protein IJW06_02890, partial [Clostridia bacterium]|nr:hypothetical protein [Clostridia bacterium]
SWSRPGFGTMGPQVRVLSPRPTKQESVNPASVFLFDRWKDSNLEKAASVKKNSLKRLFFSEAVRDGNRQSGRRAIKTQSGFVLSPRPKKQESVNPASVFLFDKRKDSKIF